MLWSISSSLRPQRSRKFRWVSALQLRALCRVAQAIFSSYSLNFVFFSSSHLSASTLRSVQAWIMTCQCFLSSAISVVIWFLAMSSFNRCCHLSFGLSQFRFPSTVISLLYGILSIPALHMSKPSQTVLSGEFCHQVHVHACLFLGVYISHKILVFSPAPETFPISSRFLPGVPGFPIHSYSVLRSRPGSSLERFPSIFISTTALMFSVSSLLSTCPNLVILLLLMTIIIGPTFSSSWPSLSVQPSPPHDHHYRSNLLLLMTIIIGPTFSSWPSLSVQPSPPHDHHYRSNLLLMTIIIGPTFSSSWPSLSV